MPCSASEPVAPPAHIDCPAILPSRGPKDLKNDMGSVNFFKHFKGTPQKRDMSDPKR